MSSIKLTADSGGGTFEIKAPSSSGNTRVLTLPDTGNYILGGRILQVVSATKTGRQLSNSSAYVDVTGMSVSITPTSTSSKIYIAVNAHIGGDQASYLAFRVLRDSTVVTQGTHATGNRTNVSFGGRIDQNYDNYMVSFNFLDSPSTTSATTYKVQVSDAYDSSNRNIVINGTGDDANDSYTLCGTSTITVMEVAA